MLPKCQCPCGQSLELRHAISRDVVSEHGNWATFRLRFRCPRCGQATIRSFECRVGEAPAQDLEWYEQAVAEAQN